MPKSLALLLCWVGIAWLFYQDHRRRPNCSLALWLPVIWLLILGSRPLSFWLGQGHSGTNLDGNVFDRVVYSLMILTSLWILTHRRFSWATLFQENGLLVAFYTYLLITAVWSGHPFVTAKRWIKEVGAIAVILVILTESNPTEAIAAVFLRCAYVLLPLSVVFIKYVPELGRTYNAGGFVQITGVTYQKNSLGEIVLVFGLTILWKIRHDCLVLGRRFWSGANVWLLTILLCGGWLLKQSDSKTALICLVLGAWILFADRCPALRFSNRSVVWTLLVAAPLLLILDRVLHISQAVLLMLGRDPTFTGRTEIWDVLRSYPTNPLTGWGYLIFWDMAGKLDIDGYATSVGSAHNGYLDIYLDGGIIAVLLLSWWLVWLSLRAAREFVEGSEYGRIRFAFVVIMVLYNLSESMYARRSPIWFAFLLFALQFKRLPSAFPSPSATQSKIVEGFSTASSVSAV